MAQLNSRNCTTRAAIKVFAVCAVLFLLAGMGLYASDDASAYPGGGEARSRLSAIAPLLGTAASFAVLASSTVTNTGPTIVNGNVGVSPGAAVTGFPPGTVVGGTIHAADALAAQAQSDTTTAYTNLAGQACNTNLTGQDLGGLTLTPGVYCFSSSAQLTGPVTLNAEGNPNAVFVFQIGSTLTTASASSVVGINSPSGAICNVFWQVGSSATLGTTTSFAGNILALASITLNTGASVSGRALARTAAVTMDTNKVFSNFCLPATIPLPIPTPTPVPTLPPTATPVPTPPLGPGLTPVPTPPLGPGATPTPPLIIVPVTPGILVGGLSLPTGIPVVFPGITAGIPILPGRPQRIVQPAPIAIAQPALIASVAPSPSPIPSPSVTVGPPPPPPPLPPIVSLSPGPPPPPIVSLAPTTIAATATAVGATVVQKVIPSGPPNTGVGPGPSRLIGPAQPAETSAGATASVAGPLNSSAGTASSVSARSVSVTPRLPNTGSGGLLQSRSKRDGNIWALVLVGIAALALATTGAVACRRAR